MPSNRLLISEPPLQVLPSLAVAIGLNEAILLQQVHYWLERSGTEIGGARWIYNSFPEWQQQFPWWSEETVRRIVRGLREQGLLVAEMLSGDPRDRTLYYRIDYDRLEAVLAPHQVISPDASDQNDLMHPINLIGSYKEQRLRIKEIDQPAQAGENHPVGGGTNGTEAPKTVMASQPTDVAGNGAQRPTSPPTRDATFTSEDQAQAIWALVRGTFIYKEAEGLRYVSTLVDRYGYNQVLEAYRATVTAHERKIAGGEKQITRPITYMDAVLRGLAETADKPAATPTPTPAPTIADKLAQGSFIMIPGIGPVPASEAGYYRKQ